MDSRLRQLERDAQDDPLKQEAFIRSCYQSNQLPQDFQKLKWEYNLKQKEHSLLKKELHKLYKQEIGLTIRLIEDTLKTAPSIYAISIEINSDPDITKPLLIEGHLLSIEHEVTFLEHLGANVYLLEAAIKDLTLVGGHRFVTFEAKDDEFTTIH